MTINTFQEYAIMPLIMVVPRAHYNSSKLTVPSAIITVSVNGDLLSVSPSTKAYGSRHLIKSKTRKEPINSCAYS
jgi:hypothetical protein